MSDITKCANGKNCPLKASCYRWTAPDSEFQSYENFYDKTDPSPKDCEHYWEQ